MSIFDLVFDGGDSKGGWGGRGGQGRDAKRELSNFFPITPLHKQT